MVSSESLAISNVTGDLDSIRRDIVTQEYPTVGLFY